MTEVIKRDATTSGNRAIALFGTWMLIGLFLDGWSHAKDKPESFFSPWHGVLYSGFLAAVVWFRWNRRRATPATIDRLAIVGLLVFTAGALGDGVWHAVFGIEEDIEALLSPTHLALMVGGLLMVTLPYRTAAWSATDAPRLRDFLPTLLSVTLATALVLFFFLYRAAGGPIAQQDHAGETDQALGVAAVLVRTTVLLGATFMVLRRGRPARGSFTILYTSSSVALAGLDAFEAAVLVVPFAVGGALADVLCSNSQRQRGMFAHIGVAVPAVTWTLFFVIHAVAWGIYWPAEIWTGATSFAALAGLALAHLSVPTASGVSDTVQAGRIP